MREHHRHLGRIELRELGNELRPVKKLQRAAFDVRGIWWREGRRCGNCLHGGLRGRGEESEILSRRAGTEAHDPPVPREAGFRGSEDIDPLCQRGQLKRAIRAGRGGDLRGFQQ